MENVINSIEIIVNFFLGYTWYQVLIVSAVLVGYYFFVNDYIKGRDGFLKGEPPLYTKNSFLKYSKIPGIKKPDHSMMSSVLMYLFDNNSPVNIYVNKVSSLLLIVCIVAIGHGYYFIPILSSLIIMTSIHSFIKCTFNYGEVNIILGCMLSLVIDVMVPAYTFVDPLVILIVSIITVVILDVISSNFISNMFLRNKHYNELSCKLQ